MANLISSLWPWTAESVGNDDYIGGIETKKLTATNIAGGAYGCYAVPMG